ncbi:MAG: acyl-CoA dehydrogenase [Pseudonocardiaceae bacterium]|nr:acyl-CoA dehydrogenase [Pseudonocardiaceae bacterium]
MQLVLDQQQQELRTAVRKFLADHSPPERVRAVMDGSDVTDGYDRELWRRLATELGLVGLVVPEQHGGSGAGHVERCVVAEELGRVLTPVPFLASAVLAVDTLLALDDVAAQAELLPQLASGDLVGAVAVAEPGGSWYTAATGTTASMRDGTWVLDGCKTHVVSGDVAEFVLVHARTPEGTGWFLASGDAPGLRRTPLRTLDPTRQLSRLDFAATPVRPLAGDAAAVLAAVTDRAVVALAAEQVGGMERVLEMTTEYAKVRVQFGRTIGSYQAVKHGCADMYSAVEQACSALRYAAWTADHDTAQLPLAAALAQVVVSPAYFQATADTVVLHGGIGYTWEHDAHLYYKRAKTSELLFGSGEQQRQRLADRLGI